MKVKIVIHTMEPNTDNETWGSRHSEVWAGELDILDENVYLAKISVIAEGQPQPICDVPFSLGVGYYKWIPAEHATEEEMEGWSLHNESNTDPTER